MIVVQLLEWDPLSLPWVRRHNSLMRLWSCFVNNLSNIIDCLVYMMTEDVLDKSERVARRLHGIPW